MQRFLYLLILAMLAGTALAQNTVQSGKKVKSNEPATEYDRQSITYLLLDFGSGNYYSVLKQAFPQLKVADKYDDNSISKPYVPSPVTREESVNMFAFNTRMPDAVSAKIKDAIVKGHFANAVIAKWFSRADDGSFSVELLQQRGLYNATDADVKAAGASKLGMAKLMDTGEKLLNNSYLVVCDVVDLIDMDEHYNRLDKNSKTPAKRDKNGFFATVNAYVYKIDFNDTVNASFWQKLWVTPNDPDIQFKKQAFDNYNFPVTYLTRTSAMVEASQFNPGFVYSPKVQATRDELMLKLLTQGVANNMDAIEKNLEEFKVKASLYGTRPLTAKIGRKEGLKTDQRYFVFEMVQDKGGQVKAVRKGVIRATKHITDNRQVASGQSKTSKFYQTAGRRLDEGMLLQQKPDAGLAFTIGLATGGMQGVDGRLDINLSKYMGSKMSPMIKLYVEGGYDAMGDEININDSIYKNFVRYGGGLGKEFCFARHFKLQPYVGFGLEQLNNKDDSKSSFSTLYGHPGFILGMNLKHSIQFTWQWGYYATGKITDWNKAKRTINSYDKWADAFGRGGKTNVFGIRFEF